MKRFYINSNGRLRRKDNTLLFEKSEGEQTVKKVIPVTDVEAIYVFGELDINTKALNFLSQHDIPVHIFNYFGFYSGSFFPRKRNVSGHLLVEQVKHYIDEEKRFFLAVSFVEGAIHHMKRNLRKSGIKTEEIDRLMNRAFDVSSIPELMAIEGNVRDIYYGSFNSLIKAEGFTFEKRTRRPPDNAVNALISFGNSLLYTTTLGEIYKSQLDPTVSYLHSPRDRRFSLSLDISEIFKPLIVDSTIISLVNSGTITLEDFDQSMNCTYLNELGRKKFLRAYEEKLSSTIKHRKLKRKVSYKQLILLECFKLTKHLIGDEIYKPFKAWW